MKKIFDVPNARTIHEMLTPRLGGLAIFAGFASALTIFGDLTSPVIQKALAGTIMIFFIGLKDDIVPVSPFKKFFVQVLATGIVMFLADLRISSFYGVLGIEKLDDGVSYLFTFMVIVGITNAINLIDGVNGLAGMMVTIAGLTFGITFLEHKDPMAYLAFPLVGGVVGFLRYNFNKAIIFMGDTGSLMSGYLLAVMAIGLVERAPVIAHTPALTMAALFIPILDTIRVFMLRVLVGRSPFSPDQNHLHHRLLMLGLSHTMTVGVLALVNVLAIVLVVSLGMLSDTWLIALLMVYGILFSIILELLTRNKKDVVSL